MEVFILENNIKEWQACLRRNGIWLLVDKGLSQEREDALFYVVPDD